MDLTIALLAAAVALPQESGTSPTFRVHDLRALCRQSEERPLALDLCPFEPRRLGSNDSTHRSFDAEAFAVLLRSLLKDGGSPYDGPIRGWSEGTLEFAATTELHARVDRLIGGVEEALLGDELLEVRALRLRDDADPLAAPLEVAEAEAERLESDWIRSGRAKLLRVATVALRDAEPVATRCAATSRYARDFDVEICHGSAIHVPVVGNDEVGLALVVRAARLDGATWLDLAVREIEAAQPARVRRVEPRTWFTSPEPHEGSVLNATREELSAATFDDKVPLAIESPIHGIVALAGSFVVPNGGALWIPARTLTATGPVALLLECRVKGPWRPAVARFDHDALDRRALSVVHVGALRSRGFAPPSYDRSTFLPLHPERHLPDSTEDEALDPRWPSLAKATDLEADPYGIVAELETRLRSIDTCTIARLTPHHLIVATSAEQSGAVARAASELLAPPPTFELRGRILRGDAPVAQFRIPATAQRRVTLWSGVATACLEGWDIDVADQALVGNPEMGPLLDGYALTFVVRPESQRRGLLAVNGALCLLEEAPARTELGNAFTPVFEKSRARRLLLDDAQPFDAGKLPATLRFGGSALALEVTVAAVTKTAERPR